MSDEDDGPELPFLDEHELAARTRLFERHEELLAAAREFGELAATQGHDWAALEIAAADLDKSALFYARVRRDYGASYGACDWLLSGVRMREGSPFDPARFVDICRALYSATDAVSELITDGLPEAAISAARSVLGKAATAYYVASLSVVDYTLSLTRGERPPARR